MISDQPKKNVMERDAFHELFNVESEADMKGGFFKAFFLMIFAIEPLNLGIGEDLVKYFPNAS